MHEGGGRVPLKITKRLPLSSSPPSSNEPLDIFKIKRWWRVWVGTSSKTVWLKASATSSSRPALLWVRRKTHKTCKPTAKLREELALQARAFSKRETTIYQELASLRQSEKEVKRLLF